MEGQRGVFITGGASGLGLALAQQYLAEGWRVAVVDHDRAALERVAASVLAGALAWPADVCSEAEMGAVRDAVLAAWGRIDLVINNAGVAIAGPLERCTEQDWQWIVEVNLLGVVRGCRLFLPQLRRQRSGRVVNIASMAGFIHPPAMSAYCATKAAVVALSEALAAELAGSGVGVSVVCPAFFRSALASTARTTSRALQRAAEQHVAGARVDADQVARRVRAGIAQRRFLILTHPLESLLWRLARLLPRAWLRQLMVLLMSRRAGRRAAAP